MRSKKALKNTLTAILSELVAIVCSFILPRLILSSFGSTYNGITSSITQFLSCVVLLRAGIGGVTRAALYKPLAEKDNIKIAFRTDQSTNAILQRAKRKTVIFCIASLFALYQRSRKKAIPKADIAAY